MSVQLPATSAAPVLPDTVTATPGGNPDTDSYALTAGSFRRGVRAGFNQLGASANAFVGQMADAAGLTDFANSRFAEAEQFAKFSDAVAPEVRDYRQVHDLDSLANYITGLTGQGLASTLPSLAGGMVGARLGLRGAFVGSAAGGFVPNAGEQAQRIRGEAASPQDKALNVLGAGAAMTALDSLLPATVAARAVRPSLRTGSLPGLVAKGAATEGLTEAAQEFVGQSAHTALNPNRAVNPEEETAALINAGIGGAVSGGAMSGAGRVGELAPGAIADAARYAGDKAGPLLQAGKQKIDKLLMDRTLDVEKEPIDDADISQVKGDTEPEIMKSLDDLYEASTESLNRVWEKVHGDPRWQKYAGWTTDPVKRDEFIAEAKQRFSDLRIAPRAKDAIDRLTERVRRATDAAKDEARKSSMRTKLDVDVYDDMLSRVDQKKFHALDPEQKIRLGDALKYYTLHGFGVRQEVPDNIGLDERTAKPLPPPKPEVPDLPYEKQSLANQQKLDAYAKGLREQVSSQAVDVYAERSPRTAPEALPSELLHFFGDRTIEQVQSTAKILGAAGIAPRQRDHAAAQRETKRLVTEGRTRLETTMIAHLSPEVDNDPELRATALREFPRLLEDASDGSGERLQKAAAIMFKDPERALDAIHDLRRSDVMTGEFRLDDEEIKALSAAAPDIEGEVGAFDTRVGDHYATADAAAKALESLQSDYDKKHLKFDVRNVTPTDADGLPTGAERWAVVARDSGSAGFTQSEWNHIQENPKYNKGSLKEGVITVKGLNRGGKPAMVKVSIPRLTGLSMSDTATPGWQGAEHWAVHVLRGLGRLLGEQDTGTLVADLTGAAPYEVKAGGISEATQAQMTPGKALVDDDRQRFRGKVREGSKLLREVLDLPDDTLVYVDRKTGEGKTWGDVKKEFGSKHAATQRLQSEADALVDEALYTSPTVADIEEATFQRRGPRRRAELRYEAASKRAEALRAQVKELRDTYVGVHPDRIAAAQEELSQHEAGTPEHTRIAAAIRRANERNARVSKIPKEIRAEKRAELKKLVAEGQEAATAERIFGGAVERIDEEINRRKTTTDAPLGELGVNNADDPDSFLLGDDGPRFSDEQTGVSLHGDPGRGRGGELETGIPLRDKRSSEWQTVWKDGAPVEPDADVKQSAMDLGNKPLTDAAKAKIRAYIEKVLGPNALVAFKNMEEAGLYNFDDVDLIKIANLAIDPVGTGRHEAAHGLMKRLMTHDPKAAQVLLAAAGSPTILARLNHLLRDHPKAREQLKDPEERVAYMFQFWAAGKLRVGPQTQTWMDKAKGILRKVAALWSESLTDLGNIERAEQIFGLFHTGKLSRENVVAEVLRDELPRGPWARAEELAPAVTRAAERIFMTADGAVRDMNIPAFNGIMDKMYKSQLSTNRGPGYIQAKLEAASRFLNPFHRVMNESKEASQREALEHMQRGAPLKTAEAKAIVKATRKVLDDVYAYMKEKGVKAVVWNDKERVYEEKDLGHIENYFPRVYDRQYLLEHKGEFLQLLRDHKMDDREANATFDALVRTSKVDPQENDASSGITYFAPNTRERTLHVPDEKLAPFMRKDLGNIIQTYVTYATRRAEYAERFQNQGQEIEKAVAEAIDQGAKPHQVKLFRDAVQALEGTIGSDIHDHLKMAFGAAVTYQNIRLLPLALFSSLIDPLGIYVRGGTAGDAFNAFVRGIKDLVKTTKDAGFDLASTVGSIAEEHDSHVLADSYGTQYMTDRQRYLSGKFFKYTGMESWNKSMRVQATVAARDFIQRHAKLPGDATSQRYLAELNLTAADVKERNGKLVVDEKVRDAINMWVDSAILRPNAAVRPIYMSDPHFMLISHLKQFTYTFQKTIVARVVHEAENGNWTPAAVLAGYVPAIIAADTVRALVTPGGADDEALRKLGLGGLLLRGVQRAGLTGPGQFALDSFGDMGHGKLPVTSFAGPTVQQLLDFGYAASSGQGLGSEVKRAIPGYVLVR